MAVEVWASERQQACQSREQELGPEESGAAAPPPAGAARAVGDSGEQACASLPQRHIP